MYLYKALLSITNGRGKVILLTAFHSTLINSEDPHVSVDIEIKVKAFTVNWLSGRLCPQVIAVFVKLL